MADIRINMRIEEGECPNLFDLLTGLPGKSRAGRLRHLANIGLMIERGNLQAAMPANAVQNGQAEQNKENKEKENKIIASISSSEQQTLNGIDLDDANDLIGAVFKD